MKKIGIYLLIVMCLFITGCGEPKTKKVATLEEFNTVAANNKFAVSNNMSSYDDLDYIIGSQKASYGDIEIEMIKYSDSNSAEKVLESHIENFKSRKSTGANEKNIKGENYHKYFLISNNRYMVSVRVEDTLLFCMTLITNKETVDKVFNELGY